MWGAQPKERKGSNFAIWQPWLKASERKYEAIEDPEEVLLRFVLVSNAMKNLQIRMRREKAAKRANMGNKAFTRL